jgi:membrane fusion protein (multidrug efflux system)
VSGETPNTAGGTPALPIALSRLRSGCVASFLFFLSLVSFAHAADTKPPPPVEVKFVYPKKGDITRHITLPGNVKAYQQATLYAKVAGYLKTIRVDKGDSIKEGELLAEIEVPELIADLAKFRAEVKVAKADLDRIIEAQKKAPDLVIPQVVDHASGKFEIATASLERIETLLGFAKITAPFAGVVTMRFVDPGAFIPVATSGSSAASAAIVTLMDFGKVRVQVAVPEFDAALTIKGQPAVVSVEELPGRKFVGEITRIAYALDEATKTMLAEAELQNPKWELRPGMFAQVRIGIEKKSGVLLVPVEALAVERGGASVFTVANDVAKKVAVKTGFNDGTHIEILSGVVAEDRVILIGKQPPSSGQAVHAVEAK